MEEQEFFKPKFNCRIHNWTETTFITYLKKILNDDYEHIHRVNLGNGKIMHLVPEKIFDPFHLP